MATTKTFEAAINAAGYHLDELKYGNNSNIDMAYGSVPIGNIQKQVKWNATGQCFTRSNARMERYDLTLKETDECLKSTGNDNR